MKTHSLNIKAPLYQAVLLLNKKDKARFHMPGHGGEGSGLFASAKYDLTELDGLDNLHSPRGVIKEAEQLLAAAYKCGRAYIFTCGATACMHAALAYARTRGDILFTGEMHFSFFSGLQLMGLRAEYVPGEELKERLARGAGSLFFTSPDYMGRLNGGEVIARLCKSAGVLCAADSAHGAHFAFSELLPKSLTQTADIAIVSMHKTMDVFGGGAVLCANGECADKLAAYRSLVHTTSPSYLTMASIDCARAVWERDGKKFYKDIASAISSLALPSGYKKEGSDDLSRLVINCGGDAQDVSERLQRRGIYCEAAMGDKLVLIVTPHNVGKLGELAQALASITPKPFAPAPRLNLKKSGRSGGALSVRAAEECAGAVCGADICLYPPGVPVIFRGDILDENAVQFIKEYAYRLSPLAYGGVIVLE